MSDLMQLEVAAMDTAERAELGRYERVIERGLQTFVEVGVALMAIREGKLYRGTHATFDAYCRERWNFSKSHSNRLIDAAEVVENLTPIGVIPANESQVRPLVKLEPEQQRKAWQQAVETAPNGKVTAAHVENVAVTFAKPNATPTRTEIKPLHDAYKPLAPTQGKAVYLEPTPAAVEEPSVATTADEKYDPDDGPYGMFAREWVMNELAKGRPDNVDFKTALDLAKEYDLRVALRLNRMFSRDKFMEARLDAISERLPVAVKPSDEEVAAIADELEAQWTEPELAAFAIENQTFYEAHPLPQPVPAIIDIHPSKLRDARLSEAVALHNALVGACHRANLHFGDLTGKHTLLPPFERAVVALLKPLDSLIAILRGASPS